MYVKEGSNKRWRPMLKDKHINSKQDIVNSYQSRRRCESGVNRR